MAENRIRVGVVGLGAFGRHHARHYAANEGAVLIALADRDASRAAAAAVQYQATATTEPAELIGKVDAVSIATPASGHAALAAQFLAAGVHVLVEKPLATTVAEAEDLVERAAAAGVVLQVGHIERFSPAVREIRRRVTQPRRITTLRRAPWSERTADVDVVLDMMIHDIDHVLSLAAAPIATLSASGMAVRGALSDEAEAWLTFENGAVATLSASRVADRIERKLTVVDETHVLAADLAASALAVADRRGTTPAEVVGFPPHDSLGAEIAAFLNSIRTGERPEVDGQTGLAAVALANRLQAAIADSDIDLPLRRSL